jgi:hypothetical protein
MPPSAYWLVTHRHAFGQDLRLVQCDHPQGPLGLIPDGQDADTFLSQALFSDQFDANALDEDGHPESIECEHLPVHVMGTPGE